MQAEHIVIRPIRPEDDAPLSRIIRSNLEQFHLDIPGTAYFDPELDHLSRYYRAAPDRRAYFVAVDGADRVLGGVGLAEFSGFSHCAELQKLYLAEEVKGRGLGSRLMQQVQSCARSLGYGQMYLETHSNLQAAIRLYEKQGFQRIRRPEGVMHSTMDHFYLKEL